MIAITIEIDVNDDGFPLTNECTKNNAGNLMQKYNLSLVENSKNEILNKFVQEMKAIKNIIVGYACYSIDEVLYINNELKRYNLSLNTVYIPSEERIEKWKAEAMEYARLHGRWIGSSEGEVEVNFINFRATLQEIKDGLKNTSIEVIEA